MYSEADAESLHVELADDAICVGPAPAAESYLKIANIISAAEIGDVDAIHPGYGFLAENAHFAEICENCRIAFIGPSPANIRKMGDKSVARNTMREAGVPVTPGSDNVVRTKEDALDVARQIGYPVLIKAAAGGGGKGMRVAHNDVSLAQAFMTAGSEAERAFGNSAVYIEKYIENARHIEVQIMADAYGNIVHLGERDCTIQRRHQKLIEEAPCPVIDRDTRKKLYRSAVKAAEAVGYRSAGTVEFIYDLDQQEFYFMEMNTRVQVEHPVTEEVTGIDIIKEQIKVAAGNRISFSQKDVNLSGHAIEFRINAEDPERNFTPSPGPVELVHFPGGPGIRIDSHIFSGYVVPPHYDSLLAKVIVHGKDRTEAIARMSRALDEFEVEGVSTTLPLGRRLMADDRFRKGRYETRFLDALVDDGRLDKYVGV